MKKKPDFCRMGKYGRVIILLLAIGLAGASWAPVCRSADMETLPPASGTEEKPPGLNLGDLLPRSEEPPPEPARQWYTITDRPPPTRGRAGTARPQRPTRAQTETAPAREALPSEGEVSPDNPLPEQETAPGNQTAQTPGPPATLADGELSFLEGCWYSPEFGCKNETGIIYENIILGWIEYCFDRQGQGKRTIYAEKRVGFYEAGMYPGALRAYFDRQGRLIIDAEQSDPINGHYLCGGQVVISAIQDSSLSGTRIILGESREQCCGLGKIYSVTLSRQKPD
jgi:hypothetical protein